MNSSTNTFQANSPVCRSTAKQMYSFNKANRFATPANAACGKESYDLPSSKSRRFTSFGYGGRF